MIAPKVVAISEQDAQAIAGLNVIRSHTDQVAKDALGKFAGKIWEVAKAAFPLTDVAIRINVAENSRRLDYFAEDGSEKGTITLNPDGYGISVTKET